MHRNIDTILRDALNKKEIHIDEIPSIDLYMDQITTLLGEKFGPGFRDPEDKKVKPLTKAMINNYSKEKLLKPVKGKKYSKEHIMQLLVICSLKNILTIGEIKQVMSAMYAGGDFDMEKLISAYEQFLSQKEEEKLVIEKILEDLFAGFDPKTDRQSLFAALLTVVSLADVLKTAAEGVVDAYFPPAETKK